MGRAWFALPAALAAGEAAGGCRAPTEIELVLSTDIRCGDLRGSAVSVGALGDVETRTPAASSQTCLDSGELGSLYVVPSGSRTAEVAIKVVAGLGVDPFSCTAPEYGPGCVIARRALRYLPHTLLRLDVPLRASCAGVSCGAEESCVDGVCRSAICHDATCSENTLSPVDAGANGAGADPGDMRGLQAGAPWPMQDRSPNHTLQSPFAGPKRASLSWTFAGGPVGALTNPPAIAADGTLYLPIEGAPRLFALTPAASVKWTATLPSSGHRTPAIAADGTIYVGTETALIALKPDGTTKWSYAPDGSIFYAGPSVGPDGTIFAATVDRGVLALRPDGSRIWAFTDAHRVFSSATFGADGTIYVGSSQEHALFALTPQGALEWQFATGGAVFASPSLARDGTVYAASNDGSVYALGRDGSKKWSVPTGAPIAADIAIADDGSLVLGSGSGTIYRLRPDGSVAWTHPTGGAIEASPVLGGDGTAYVGSDDGNVYAIARDGGLVWSYTVLPTTEGAGPPRLFGGSIGADGTLYLGTSDGRLLAFGR